jgi:hypothetical protein
VRKIETVFLFAKFKYRRSRANADS